MDSSSHKFYHVHGYDTREYLDQLFSDKARSIFGEDSLIFPIEQLKKTFQLGTRMPHGGEISPLLSQSLYGMEFHIFSDSNPFVASIQCDQLEDKEGKVRSALQHVVKCDLEKENMTEPIDLPLADCIITAVLLDYISKDQNDYIRYLRKFSKLLKPGGHLILIGVLDATYLTVGKDKFHILTYDEDFARKSLVGEGFVIDRCEVKKRTNVSDFMDYKALIFIAAHKEK
ncbi:nicotinamide N-methyltransferase-like isoform X4 [Engystomops pustulosus]|uniref:nicotinamide N-methyltransferase-like isoform X4 n=1 Tax=Engystomops pustulosus TaxID=76066 RepID=UPI003AFAEAB0